MTTKQEIAREMLRIFDGKPERWNKGELFGDNHYLPEPHPHCCLLGASLLACERMGLSAAVEAAFDEVLESRVGNVGAWNDATERTFDDVVKLLTDIAEAP